MRFYNLLSSLFEIMLKLLFKYTCQNIYLLQV